MTRQHFLSTAVPKYLSPRLWWYLHPSVGNSCRFSCNPVSYRTHWSLGQQMALTLLSGFKCCGVSLQSVWSVKRGLLGSGVTLPHFKFESDSGNASFVKPCDEFCFGTETDEQLVLQGISMVIGGCKHREQRFNSRSAGISSALLFISVGGRCQEGCGYFLTSQPH